MNTTIIILIILTIILVLMYNSLIAKKNQVENLFASVDVQLKKRYDLVPNIVASVKKYMDHESSLLEEITFLRSQGIKRNMNDSEKINIDKKFSKALAGLMVTVEEYPELKASENIIELQKSLNEIEEQISASRRAYNQAVTDYNNAIEMIPTNFMAKTMNYKEKKLFEIEDTQKDNILVEELFNNK
jgi:LemA protein